LATSSPNFLVIPFIDIRTLPTLRVLVTNYVRCSI